MFTDILIKMFGDQSGPLSRIIAGAVTSLLVYLAFKFFNWQISAEDELYVNGLITAGVLWILTEIASKLKERRAKEVQAAVNTIVSKQVPFLKEDGKIGDKTVEVVQQMADIVNMTDKKIISEVASDTANTKKLQE